MNFSAATYTSSASIKEIHRNRTKILSFKALKLEEDGILGEGISSCLRKI